MDVAGRWLPDGVRVERTADGRVLLRGGDHDGMEFSSVADLRDFARRTWPDLRPSS